MIQTQTNKIKIEDEDLILEAQKELKEYRGIEVECEDIILTQKAIAIEKNGIIQLIKTYHKKDDNEIIYGI